MGRSVGEVGKGEDMPGSHGLKDKKILRTVTPSLEIYLLRRKMKKRLVFILYMQEFCKQRQGIMFAIQGGQKYQNEK